MPDDTSVAKLVDEAPASTHVAKGFNTLFSQILASGEPADVFFAGDDAQAKANVSTLITSLGFRPRDTGDLSMAHWRLRAPRCSSKSARMSSSPGATRTRWMRP